MKNKIILCMILLCILPITLAELKLDKIKIYVNNELYSSADEDGGDIDVERGDDLMIKSFFDNNMDNTSYVRLKGVLENIDNGDDLTEWKPGSDNDDWYDIDENEDESKTLSFSIPDDTDYDEYDLDLTIYYKYQNETESTWDYSWDVIVESLDEEESDLDEKINELTSKIDNINCSSEGGKYYSLYLECFTDLTTCDDYKEDNEEYKSQYLESNTLKNNYYQQLLNANLSYSYLNYTYSQCVTDKENYRGQKNLLPVIFSGLTALGFFAYFKYFKGYRREGKYATSKEVSPDSEAVDLSKVKTTHNPKTGKDEMDLRNVRFGGKK